MLPLELYFMSFGCIYPAVELHKYIQLYGMLPNGSPKGLNIIYTPTASSKFSIPTILLIFGINNIVFFILFFSGRGIMVAHYDVISLSLVINEAENIFMFLLAF